MTPANRPGFRLVVDGTDYAAAMSRYFAAEPPDDQAGAVERLVELTIEEKLGEEADTVTIVLSNHDGGLPVIQRGRVAEVALGWVGGREVPLGMVDKGSFTIDEVSKIFGPDTLSIRARSADFTGALRNRRDREWKGKTLGEIVGEVARQYGYQARVHPDLASIALPSAEQAAKSDIAFIRDLGERYDAVATVKAGNLLFLPIGAETTASGAAIGTVEISRLMCAGGRFTVADREDHDGAVAQWQDRKGARARTVKAGGAENPKRIKRRFASEAEAKAAAEAEARKAARGQYTFSCDLSLGDAAISPNQRATLVGWDEEADGVEWLVESVRHTLSGAGGFTSSVDLVSLG